jgi:hypothetical protein
MSLFHILVLITNFKRMGNLRTLLLLSLWTAVSSSSLAEGSEPVTRSFNYANTTEHCDDLWSFQGTNEAPMVVTNVTLYPYNATDGTPAFCHVDGQVATYIGVSLRLPALGADWAGIYHQQGCGGPCGYRYMDTYWYERAFIQSNRRHENFETNER